MRADSGVVDSLVRCVCGWLQQPLDRGNRCGSVCLKSNPNSVRNAHTEFFRLGFFTCTCRQMCCLDGLVFMDYSSMETVGVSLTLVNNMFYELYEKKINTIVTLKHSVQQYL